MTIVMRRLAIVLMGAMLLGLQGCPAPGEGRKAEYGYALCAPIIEALSRYSGRNGAYPETFDALIPEYVTDIPTQIHAYPLRYERTTTSYELEFRYERPGMNICQYTPETGWQCYGYF